MKEKILEGMKEILDEEQLILLEMIINEAIKEEQQVVIKSNQELLDGFIEAKRFKGCTERTIEIYARDVKWLINWTEKSLIELNKKDIERYLVYFKNNRNVSNVTINNTRRNLSSFYNYLECEEFITSNPVKKIQPLKQIKTVKRAFNEIEVDKLRNIDKSKLGTRALREHAIVDTLVTTGIRVSELCSLNKSDLKDDHTAIVFGKGQKERIIYFSDLSWASVQEYLKSRDDDNEALFVTTKKVDGKYHRVNRKLVECSIRDMGRDLGIHAYPHKFRRTVASRLINKGVPIQSVQQVLGHEKIETTMMYCDLNQANIKYEHSRFIS